MRKGPQTGIYFGTVALPSFVMSPSDDFLVQERKRREKRRSIRGVTKCRAGLRGLRNFINKVWSAPPTPSLNFKSHWPDTQPLGKS